MTADIKGSFPMLEFEPGTLMCDSLPIAALLIRSSGNESLLGSNLQEQNDQIEWMRFIRETCFPQIKSLKMMTFGQYTPTEGEYLSIYSEYQKSMEVFQAHLKTKRMYMVGGNMTISDIFFVLSQIEMYQCIMDP